jgi:hypothetical protein
VARAGKRKSVRRASRESAKQRKARIARQRRLERAAIAESKRLSEQSYRRKRKSVAIERAKFGRTEVSRIHDVLRYMQSTSPTRLELRIDDAPTEEGLLLWIARGTFFFKDGGDYFTLHQTLAQWAGDLALEAQINPRRECWIRWEYRKDGEGYSPAGAGPWETVASEAEADSDTDDEDSVGGRYDASTIYKLQVYCGRILR